MDKEDRSIHNSIYWAFPWKLRSPRPLGKCLGLRNHIKGTLIAAERDFCLKRLVTAESKGEYKTTPDDRTPVLAVRMDSPIPEIFLGFLVSFTLYILLGFRLKP